MAFEACHSDDNFIVQVSFTHCGKSFTGHGHKRKLGTKIFLDEAPYMISDPFKETCMIVSKSGHPAAVYKHLESHRKKSL